MRIREYAGADFEPLAGILGETWHARHGEHSFWQGADELCDHLAQTDHGFAAMGDDGQLLGVILLASPRPEDKNDMQRMHWLQQRTRLAAMANALGIDARADVAWLNDENELMARAQRELGGENVGEVVLLIVSPEARGAGVGGRLWETGVAWLAEHGTHTVRLVTDDGCDWQFYEHLGLEQMIRQPASQDPACHLYLYEMAV